ncbi:MAG: hypothetical protein ABIF12_03265 [bacterium]
MKFKIFKKLLLIIFFTSQLYSYSGKTFFMPRPIQQDIVLQKISSKNFINKIIKNKSIIKTNIVKIPFIDANQIKQSKKMGGLKILGTMFYKESTNSSDLASYFFPEGKTELSVQGPNVAGIPDISSTWLAIANADQELIRDFSSKISIRPKQKAFGFNLQLFKSLNFINKRILLGASLPFIQVETNLNFNEYDKSIQTEKLPLDLSNKYLAANATEAFDHPLLKYSKMKNGVQKLAGLADIKISLDGLIKTNNLVDINLYGFGIIPTGYHPKVEYLFEPILGNGKHFGAGAGANINVNAWKYKDKKILVSAGGEYQYLFEATNKRTFDLKNNGSFSRYLDIRRNGVGQTFNVTDLANVSTLNCKTTPRSNLNSFIDIAFSYKKYLLKIGYNLWWRDSEKINLSERLEEIYAITGTDIDAQGNVVMEDYFPNATIKNHSNAHHNAPFNVITPSDINLDSGKINQALSNTFYLNAGWNGYLYDKKYWINSGISYEIASQNNILSNWELFLQLGIAI